MISPVDTLVADDNIDAAITLASVLELLGHTVRVAHDGQAAVTFAEQDRPTLIFLDLGMPEIDGWECCRQIRALTWNKRPRIIAVSGYGTDEAREESQRAGFDEHCLKPLDLEAVKRLILV